MDNNFQNFLDKASGNLTIYELGVVKEQLTEYINYLLVNDFDKLIQLLYRIDIDEHKLKSMIAVNTGSDSASIIAEQIIQRQIQKSITRKHSNPGTAIDENDKW